MFVGFSAIVSASDELTGQAVISDDFNSSTLNGSIWTFIDPLEDATLIMTGTQASITVPAGTSHDVWASGNNAPRIMQYVSDTDFEIEVKFESQPTSEYQMQGVIVQQDDSNYIRFDFLRDATNTKAFAASFISGTPTGRSNVIISPGNPLYLKVNRQGDQWTQSYSYDGTSWIEAATFNHAITVTSLGPFVGNHGVPENSSPAFTGLIDYFNTSFPIVPEDEDTSPPQIDLWYGNYQRFGDIGVPQRYANILGNVHDSSGIASLNYSLNGGSDQPLSIGPDGLRLQSNGDFNVEINVTDLTCDSNNSVVIRATNYAGNTTNEEVIVHYSCNNIWPETYSINWNSVTNIQDPVQVVDGMWIKETNSIRPSIIGYDRAVAMGDNTWDDYEVTVPITINTPMDSSVIHGPNVGIIMRWQGYYNEGGEQPSSEWWPLGALGVYIWVPQLNDYRLQIIGNNMQLIANDESAKHLEVGVPYMFKMRAETIDTNTLYSLKVWEQVEDEPSEWTISGYGVPGELKHGSIMLASYYVDASFGNVTIRPDPFDDPLAIFNVETIVDASSATIRWDTNELATSNVSYGLSTGYENGSINDTTLVTSHEITLPDLTLGTNYHYQITSEDEVGNSVSTSDLNFTTLDDSPIISDDFNASTLNTTLWTEFDPKNDAIFEMVGTGTSDAWLNITVPAGISHDVWASGNYAPRIMQAAKNTDFDIEVKFESQLTSQYQMQGVIVQQDDSNYLRFDFYRDATNTKVFAGSFTGGTPTQESDVIISPADNPLYLRVKRQGDQWTQSYSFDGTSWIEVTNFNHALTVTSVGPFVGNQGYPDSSYSPAFTGLIDYFFNSTSPIIPEDGGDNEPPTVTDNEPTGTNVPVTTQINVTFSEAMNQTSAESAFNTSPETTGSFAWNDNNMTYTPDSDLTSDTTYGVTIGTGAEDLSGNPLATAYIWDFTTAAESDITAPTVTDNTPTGTAVPVTTVITVTFNESMNTTSVEDAFSIDPSVAGTLSWSGDTMTFTSTADLAYYTMHEVTIGTGAEDLSGNPLATAYIWDFTTAAESDITAPTVTDNTPTGTAVPVTTVITVTFNESMNTTSVEDAFSINPSVAGTLSWSGDTMTYTPDSYLASNTKYTVTIGTDAKDLAENNMETEHTWNFTSEVSDNTPPIATITEPDDGACIKGIINIIGTANDTNFKSYSVEWKNTTVDWTEIRNSTESVSGGILATWNTTDLEDGDYMIRLTVIDNASNSNTTTVNLTIDSIQPEVNITEPGNESDLKFFENIVRGEVNDDNLYSAQLTVINEAGENVSSYDLNIRGGEFSKRVEFAPYQNNTLELVAVDKTGNSNSTNVTVFVWNNTLFNETDVNQSKPVIIDAKNETDTLIEFVSNVTKSNLTFTVTAITNETEINELNNSVFIVSDEMAVGRIVEINVTGLDVTNKSEVQSVTINLYYTIGDLDLDGDGTIETGELDENNLYIYWYNGTNWTKLTKEDNSDMVINNGQVKITGDVPGYVWAKVNHLSMFALAALPVPEPTEYKDNDGGGGSSGGGGGTSGENYYNILLSETDRQSIFKNSDVSFIFDLEDNIVRHINFTALKSAGTVAAKVEILNNTSTLVSTPPPNKVYKNLNVWVGNAGWATNRNIADTTVVFTVDKSWITENNIDGPSIALYRYSDDTWHKLVTRKIAEDANSLQFEAETPGFSPFAVTGKEEEGEPDGTGIIAEPTVTVDKTPVPTPTDKKGIPGFGLFAGLSVLLLAVQLLRKKK
ncbi:MAG: PGF-pre-PGF domain-containing protein [ANME-2 cluster archaeon]|nr:PGF-pre-PGF domain-containing protein [ANME-2 cluster archaeon]MBC2709337.1 PGF-pre-PGF domain-containing protein [ANME-2 cluster archaeon]